MKYFTAEELKTLNRAEVSEKLTRCIAQLVRFNFAINTFKNCSKKLFNNNQNIKILDLGSGNGTFASQLNKIGYNNIYGLDIDNYVPDDRKQLFQEFKTADLSWDKIPWRDNNFQIATAWCVLPHLENPFHCVREVHRVLDKNGLFVFTVLHLTSKPAIDYLKKHQNFGHYQTKNNHITMFTASTIEKTILKYFDLLDIQYAVRPKIFERGIKGKLRKILYNIARKTSPQFKKRLDHRWAYDAIYIIKKK